MTPGDSHVPRVLADARLGHPWKDHALSAVALTKKRESHFYRSPGCS